MGLPIFRSPPSSPRPVQAHTCDAAGPTRTTIRRRISPRTSPRDSQQRWIPSSASSRSRREPQSIPAFGPMSRMDGDGLDSRSSHLSTLSTSLSALNARLNDLQETAIALRTERRQFTDFRRTADAQSSPIEPSLIAARLSERYERTERRYRNRLQAARMELQRLEAEGLAVSEQRRRLLRLHEDFGSHANVIQITPRRVSEHEQPEPQVSILSVPDRFTSSPQPLVEHMSSGAVRAASHGYAGPEMELPALRRMGFRSHSPEIFAVPRTVTHPISPIIDGPIDGALHSPIVGTLDGPIDGPTDGPVDGLGDRARSVESDSPENWNLMLSTIAPDTRLPSASSSFASAAASASFGSNNSSRAPSAFSAGTSITVPEDNDCDIGEVWHCIGDRLNRGEDVPDELWVNVGAPDHIARNLAQSTRERL